MNTVHLILPDLFLPKPFAAEVSADLALPALRKLLARATATSLVSEARSVEAALCDAFAVRVQNDVPIAPISAAYDRLEAGCYLRADPVSLHLQRDQMLLDVVAISDAEAAQFCASLNEYFAGQGMLFFAPHPQRWYVRVEAVPDMQTTPLSEVIGANVRGFLPRGLDAPRWHQVFNEIQMLLYAHPLNAAREERGELPINSLWLWGSGALAHCEKHYDCVASDEVLAEMFAAAASIPQQTLAAHWQAQQGRQLVLHTALRRALQRGDLHGWREAIVTFETAYAQPLWAALCTGKLQRLQLDILAGENSQSLLVARRDTWKIWRISKPLAAYSLV